MNEDAAKYAERAQRLQRRVLRLLGKLGWAAWSWFLDALAGYGYQPGRMVFWYILVVVGFAALYYLLGPSEGHAFSPRGRWYSA